MRSTSILCALALVPALVAAAPPIAAPVCELASSTTTGFRSVSQQWSDPDAERVVQLAGSTTTGFSSLPVVCVAPRQVDLAPLCAAVGWPAALCADRVEACIVQHVVTKAGATAFVITCDRG